MKHRERFSFDFRAGRRVAGRAPLALFLFWLAFDLLTASGRTPGAGQAWLGGIALAVAILFRITSLIWLPGFLLLALWPLLEKIRRQGDKETERFISLSPCPLVFLSVNCLAALLPAVAANGLMGAYNAVRFGSPLSFGYHEARWEYPFLDGLLGLLARPGKGLFVYNPPLLFGATGLLLFLAEPRRRAAGATIIVLTALTLAYLSPYLYWHGGCHWFPCSCCRPGHCWRLPQPGASGWPGPACVCWGSSSTSRPSWSIMPAI